MEKIPSFRRQVRVARLAMAIEEAGGPTALALLIGTPKSHISAMTKGRRGVGDDLAAKIEAKLEKTTGWMDLPLEAAPQADAIEGTDTDWAMLAAFQDMLEGDRQAMLAEALAKAETARKVYQEAIAKFTPKATAGPDAFVPKSPVVTKTAGTATRKRVTKRSPR